MRLKVIITTVFFLGAIFTGSVFAADTPADPQAGTRDGAAEGQRGVPMQESRPGQTQDQQAGALGQDQDEIAGMHKADDLMGKNIVAQDGEELGSIDNLVISENGQVEYIILSRGGVMGVGGDLVPVPWNAANLKKDQDDNFRADITQQQLEGAPTFDGDNWAQIASPEYEQQVHSYYGTEPRKDQGMQSPMMNERSPKTTD